MFEFSRQGYKSSKKEQKVVNTVWGIIKLLLFAGLLFAIWALSHF